MLDFLSYKVNGSFLVKKYKCYDVADNQMKSCKIFSPLLQFKYNGFEFAYRKRIAVFRTVIDGEGKKLNVVWNGNKKTLILILTGIILTLSFFFDKSENRFVPNKFYTEVLHIALDEYLRHRKKLDVNVF